MLALLEQDDELQTLSSPAQSPQKVMSKTIWRSLKWLSISQDPANLAAGVPQPVGSGLPDEMSDGMELEGKNQTEIASPVHSVAYTPPPASLNPLPYDWEFPFMIAQPLLGDWPPAST